MPVSTSPLLSVTEASAAYLLIFYSSIQIIIDNAKKICYIEVEVRSPLQRTLTKGRTTLPQFQVGPGRVVEGERKELRRMTSNYKEEKKRYEAGPF